MRAQPGGGQAAVRLPRVPHVRRPARRGARTGGRRAVGRRAPAARRRGHRERVAGRAARAARLARRPRPRRGVGRRAGSRPSCSGSPSSPTATPAAVTWVPADHLADAAVAAALAAAAGARPRRQAADALAAEARHRPRATCSSTRRSPPTCSTRPRPATSCPTSSSATPASPPRPTTPAAKGQLDLDGTQADPTTAAGRQALAVHHLAEPIADQPRRAGHGRAVPRRSRTRSCACWPGWSTPASPSTWPSCAHLNERLTADVVRLGAELKEVVGRDDLNINSPIQLRELLYAAPPAGRGLTPIKKTKTGPSTDAATLEKLRDEWPEFIGPLLQYREVEKLRGTYGEGLLAEVAADGRIHATFNQTVARTGRLSSDQPNLHNIPVRRDEGRLFRKAFIPRPGRQAARRRLQPDRAALHRPPRRRPGPGRRVHAAARTSTTPRRRGSSAWRRPTSRSTSARRRRWCRTGWPTAWRPTGSASA